VAAFDEKNRSKKSRASVPLSDVREKMQEHIEKAHIFTELS
jgi:hypothetical protein